MENHTIVGRFRLTKQIEADNFGQIFECTRLRSGRSYAAKIENNTRLPQLAHESTIYRTLSNDVNVCRPHWSGDRVAVFDLLGNSLEQLWTKFVRLSLKSVLMLIEQMLRAIEFVHRRSFVHRNIKPNNFVMGRGGAGDQFYIVNFGLAKPFRDAQSLVHHPIATGRNLTGTARYASLNALRGIEQSRRDDMEAIGYVWIYLLADPLPWMGISATTPAERNQLICDCKCETTFEVLCEGLPYEFVEYFKCIRELQFMDEPPYAMLCAMIRDLAIRFGFACDGVYEWNRVAVMGRVGVMECSDDPPSSSAGESEITAGDDSSGSSDTADSDTSQTLPVSSEVKNQGVVAWEARTVKKVMITRKKSTTAHSPARFLQHDRLSIVSRNPMGIAAPRQFVELRGGDCFRILKSQSNRYGSISTCVASLDQWSRIID
jgi:serine/threonine protein kinase